MLEKVRRGQLRWRDALAEMGPEGLVKRVCEAEMVGSRRRRQPKKDGLIILSNDRSIHIH